MQEFEQGGADSSPEQLGQEIDALGADLDDVVLAAVDAAFSPAFAVTGAMALLAALLLLFRLGGGGRTARGPPAAVLIGAALVLALVLPAGYAIAEAGLEPEPAQIADPCNDRERDSVGGLEGVVEDVALRGLDRAACRFGSSREQLVLALFDDESQRAYEREHDVDPRQLDDLLRGIVGL